MYSSLFPPSPSHYLPSLSLSLPLALTLSLLSLILLSLPSLTFL
jgi:hypothetical protein